MQIINVCMTILGMQIVSSEKLVDYYNFPDLQLDGKVGQQICSEVDSDISYFYDISGAPGLNIKPPQENGYQVFLQSTSQGSRCLQADSLLLYKVSNISHVRIIINNYLIYYIYPRKKKSRFHRKKNSL